MKKFLKTASTVSMAILVGALTFWAVAGEDARKFDRLRKNALCVLELEAETPSTSTTFTTSKKIDMFQVGVRPKGSRERFSLSISGSNGPVCSVTNTNSTRFGFGRNIPQGTYEITLSQKAGNKGVLVVVADEKPVPHITGWQIVSRVYLGFLVLSGIWAFVARKSKNAKYRATSLYMFQMLLLCFMAMFFYLLFHESGHALGQIAFGRFSFARSDFWGIHGHPHSGGIPGPPLKPWQQAIITGGGPMLPTFAGWALFLLWRSRFGRARRQVRPIVNLYFSGIVAFLVFPEFVSRPCCLLGIISSEDEAISFIANLPGPMWLLKGLLWVTFIVSVLILWRVLPEIWRSWKAQCLRLRDSCVR